jgi:hypothetical protein
MFTSGRYLAISLLPPYFYSCFPSLMIEMLVTTSISMMAVTIRSSANVKPLLFFFIEHHFHSHNNAHRFLKLRKTTSLCANVHVENCRSGGPSRSSPYVLMNHILILRPQVPKSAENGLILRNSPGSLQAMDRRA